MSRRTWNDGEAGGTPITADALNDIEADLASSLKQWEPDTAYLVGDQVVNPSGDVVTAISGHVSPTGYSPTPWRLSSSFEPKLPDSDTTKYLRGDRQWVTLDLSSGGDGIGGGEAFEHAPVATDIGGTVGSKLNIPTHVTPTGGQTTHPSVVFIPEGWGEGNYKYWMAHTPYPGGSDDHEDPNIVCSINGLNWETPAGLVNPIDDQSGNPEYNSDVELVLGPNNTMFLFWRFFNPNQPGQEEQLFYSTSQDGVVWTPKTRFRVASQATERLLSPTLIYEDGRWVMWAVDIAPSPNKVVRLETSTPDLTGPWTDPLVIPVGTMQSGKEPWHISIIKHAGRYVGILNDCTIDQSGAAGDLLFIQSANGKAFANSGTSVIPRVNSGEHNSLYRATLIPAVQDGLMGYRVWYSAYLTGSPNVWNVYRTWVGASPTTTGANARASGNVSLSATLAAGAGTSIAVTFPAGRFSSPPYVHVDTNSTRCNIARSSVTATGFTFLINNWTTANVGTSSEFYWRADAV